LFQRIGYWSKQKRLESHLLLANNLTLPNLSFPHGMQEMQAAQAPLVFQWANVDLLVVSERSLIDLPWGRGILCVCEHPASDDRAHAEWRI
jgi:hypothetical protein